MYKHTQKSRKEKEKKRDEQYLTIPKSKPAETIGIELGRTGFKVAFTVYKVSCASCSKSYIGETGGESKLD